MRVLINAASAHMGGAVTYLQNVLQWLPKVASEDRFLVVLPDATRQKLTDLKAASNVKFETYPYSYTGGGARLYFDQKIIPRLVRSEHIDVLFSATGFGTFACSCPEVLLVRNPVYFNREFQAKYRDLGRSLRRITLRRWLSLLSIRRADAVLFPTLAMQRMVEQYLPLQGKQTRVLHYGFDPKRFWANGYEESAMIEELRGWKADGYHLLLNVSTYAVHKNFETLIEALPLLLEKGLKLKLLTTTSRERTTDKIEYDALKRRALELGAHEAWIELGYVPYHQLHSLYRVADLFAFPSFTESFGHSMVEAMAAGLPVVAADTRVNREVCEDAGSYFSTYDPVDCAAVVEALLRKTEATRNQAAVAKARSERFSWQHYTEHLVTLFHELSR